MWLLVVACADAQPVVRSQLLPLVQRWSVELSAPAAAAVISGDIIVVSLVEAGVVAYRASDGTEAWRVDLAAVHPVSADDERAYIVSRERIHALRLSDGQELWRADIGALSAAPLVRSGWVILATADDLAALRAGDGSTVWRRSIGTVESQPAIDGDWLFVPLLLETRLVAIDLRTGETRWETELGGAPAEPLAIGGKVYACASDKSFYAMDADDGDIEWTLRVGAGPRGRAVVDEDHVYFVALDNILRAIDRGHGAVEWMKGLAYRPASGPMLMGSAVIVPGAVASLPTFAADGESLSPLVFPATLVGLTNVTKGPLDHPVVGAITGDIQHPWMLSLLETSLDPPPIPVVPVTTLPGQVLAIALPA